MKEERKLLMKESVICFVVHPAGTCSVTQRDWRLARNGKEKGGERVDCERGLGIYLAKVC